MAEQPGQREATQHKKVAGTWMMTATVLLVGFLLSVLAGNYHAEIEVSKRKEMFTRGAEIAHHVIGQQVVAAGHMVRAFQAALSGGPQVSEQDLQRAYMALDPKSVIPGLQAVAYAHRVPGQDGGKDRYVITAVLPQKGNEDLMGMDISARPATMKALMLAQATHAPVLAEPAPILQDRAPGQAPADRMVIRIPVYSPDHAIQEEDLPVGSVGISFRMNGMMQDALSRGQGSSLAIRVVDTTDGQPRLVYSRGEPDLQATISRSVVVGGRQWQVLISPQKGMLDASAWPVGTLLAGLLVTSLLGLLVFSLSGTREKARVMALEMTRKYQDSEERFRILNEHLPGMVLLADDDGKITYANRATRSTFNLPTLANDHPGKPATLMDLFGLPNLLGQLQALGEQEPYLTVPRVRVDAHAEKRAWLSLSFALVKFHGRNHILALGSDISDIIELSEQIALQSKQMQFQATHDELTGMPNRRDFETRLAVAITEHKRGGSAPTLLYVDLDQFKIINDTVGHIAGDRLLVSAAEGLRALLDKDECVARLGGDEFGVLILDAPSERAIEVAESIRSFFNGFKFAWEGVNHQVTCSIGLARLQPGQSKEGLMAEADAACYIAKERGRNRWHSTENDVESIARRVEMNWVARIRSAMAENRLRLYYQDICPLELRGKTDGAHFEILLRMHESDGSLVPAGEFIPAAERYGLMGAIDRWTVEMALRNFQFLHPSRNIQMCAINLSGQTISDPMFEPFLLDAVDRWRVSAASICLEITETAAINNMDSMVGFIARLRAMGFRIALDDFGAGMSSFGYLKTLKSDIVKIDGSFVRDMDHDELSQSIVRAVTEIAHKMDMQVVAEWVGSHRTVEHLQRLGVDFGQGFFLSNPQPCPIPFSSFRKAHRPTGQGNIRGS